MSEKYRFKHSVRDRRQVFSLSISDSEVWRSLCPLTRWCSEMFGPAGGHSSARWRTKISGWGNTHRAEISFRKEADAIVFKLRWG
jgi:hypothetical protein